jgi:hypothetical protein
MSPNINFSEVRKVINNQFEMVVYYLDGSIKVFDQNNDEPIGVY